MIFKFRTGFEEFEELNITEEQALDLLDFVLNRPSEYYPSNSIYLNNSALVANLKIGKKLSAEFIDDYLYNSMMQK